MYQPLCMMQPGGVWVEAEHSYRWTYIQLARAALKAAGKICMIGGPGATWHIWSSLPVVPWQGQGAGGGWIAPYPCCVASVASVAEPKSVCLPVPVFRRALLLRRNGLAW